MKTLKGQLTYQIGIYDKNDNLIMIASLAKPIRKRENDEYTFKLTYDI